MAGKSEDDREKLNSASGLAGILKGLASLVEAVGKLEKEGLTEISKSGRFERGRNLKGIYGYTVRMGLEGTPLLERFGHVIKEEKLPEEDMREPIVDIIPEEDHFLIIAEMPGVDESDIDVQFGKESVLITADGKNSGRKYRKEIIVEGVTKPVQFTKNYHNGILEIRLKKK